MDLEQLIPSDTADCEIMHPVTNEPTGIVVTVYGIDSDQFRAVMLDAKRAASDGKDDDVKVTCKRLSMLTHSWKGIERNGKPLEFSQAEAAKVYEQVPTIRRQVDAFIFKAANFLPKA